ncbi:uncharacterized protein BT62DRAFT_990088 [Guyanagaster necrorhizus]|uniref:Uncharacterized protein n=1 Tax=Guyanagaster necrorhizus TaxID=856835 RepID=A0A9P8B0I6_9AGAR|nr:uncharacterized protein BT62DRAFT_990088 [Guyanagaster necrorhizus MCA 3950]KAG7453157.1 hypothetical protein BT62DRAFT_990088 [Guyanagaster necrorhizus MCA 3950]
MSSTDQSSSVLQMQTLQGKSVTYIVFGLLAAILVVGLCFTLFWMSRMRRRRRFQAEDGILPPFGILPSKEMPQCHEIWLGTPSSTFSWNDIRPLSIEKLPLPVSTPIPPPSPKVRRFFFKKAEIQSLSSVSKSTVTSCDSLPSHFSIDEKETIQEAFRVSVLIAMPSPSPSNAEMNVGVTSTTT